MWLVFSAAIQADEAAQEIARRFRTALSVALLTQDQAARMMGVPVQHVHEMCHGQRHIPLGKTPHLGFRFACEFIPAYMAVAAQFGVVAVHLERKSA